MRFCESPDKYVHELSICSMNTQWPKSALTINKNFSVNHYVTSGFDVVRKILLNCRLCERLNMFYDVQPKEP